MIAVDTNVLVGAIQTFDLQLRATARRAVKSLFRQGEQLLCFPQNLVEFWNASTRPANGKWSRLSLLSRRPDTSIAFKRYSTPPRDAGNFPNLAQTRA